MNDYLKELNMTVSVCDADGAIVYINDKGLETFGGDGGADLLGNNILDCHPEPSKSKLAAMMKSHISQSYTKGEGDRYRLIHQAPIYKKGVFDGYIEFIIPLPGLKGSL